MYKPNPIDTKEVQLSEQIEGLTELLAKNAHEIWAEQRIKDGWTLGPVRNDAMKQHPCLISYEELPDSEKQYDRNAALETLKLIMALGYRLEKSEE